MTTYEIIITTLFAVTCAAVLILLLKKSSPKGEKEADLKESIKNQNELMIKLLSGVSQSNREQNEAMRAQLDRRLSMLSRENSEKLEQMRRSVESGLSSGVRNGIEGSFKSVSDQLETLARSLGELKNMSGDISGLKRVLGGIKQRGNWGEAQLESILSDMLAPEYYKEQFCVAGGREAVDFAVKLPGEDVYLPIDSKFPMERYEAVIRAQDTGDSALLKKAGEDIVRAVTDQAKSIKKYVCPPKTTDFAVMFLPSEAIYTYLSAKGLSRSLMREYGVLLAGPSVISAIISAVDMSAVKFAVEQKSEDILRVLKNTQSEIGKLSESLALAKRNTELALNHIDGAKKKTDRLSNVLSEASQL